MTLFALAAALAAAAAPAAAARLQSGMSLEASSRHDTSAPLWLIAPPPHATPSEHEPRPFRSWRDKFPQVHADPVRQSAAPLLLASPTARSFAGVGDAFLNHDGSHYLINGHPPDTDGDVGANHYVQIVNTAFAVFDKQGALLFGAADTNTLWSGFGGPCQNDNDGDGVVLYDSIADRWFITQFAVPAGGPFAQCIAVSATPDPTGQFHRYSFPYKGFNDYGKFGVWPDAYYATFNMFSDDSSSSVFQGSKVCAYDRAAMLQGNAATQQCFDLFQTDSQSNALYGGVLPSDLDGPTLPPAGAPNLLVTIEGQRQLQLWKFHVDWATPGNSTLTGGGACTAASCPPIALDVAPYTPLCYQNNGDGTCVQQPGGAGPLDSLGDRPMYRVSYRRFGDHESLLLNHSVVAGATGGVRWYELRDLSAAVPTLFQQGTYAPGDAEFRWMGSLAMDAQGDIALGFSKSGADLSPGIYFTSRSAGDTPGVMTQAEALLTAGGSAQIGSGPGYVRWGDYSDMSIDPVDDCTFWYTQQYIPNTTSHDWRTTISSFQLPSCVSFSVASAASSVVVGRGDPASTVTVTTGNSGTFAGLLDLSVTGLPAGVTASFSPATVTAGTSSTLSLTAAAGSLTVRGVSLGIVATLQGSGAVRSTALSLDVIGNEFALGAGASAVAVSAGTSKTVTFHTSIVHGTAESLVFTVSAPPAGLTAAFTPASVTAGEDAVLTLTASPTAADETQSLTVSAAAANSTHAQPLAVTVLTLPVPALLLPAAGATVKGAATFSLSTGVSPATTLARLEVLADGNPIGDAAVSSPANLVIDTHGLSNGAHQFAARATDGNGGVGTSASISLTVDNPSGCASYGGADLAGLLAALTFAARRRRSNS